MRMIVEVELEVKLEGWRSNLEEIFVAVDEVDEELRARLATSIIEQYQEEVVRILCTPSGRSAKKGLGGHDHKGIPGRRCRCRTFRRAGHWSEERRLQGKKLTVRFRPAIIECQNCGKKFTPVLEALELEPHQRWSTGLEQLAMEAVADTSYRRGAHQLEVLGEVPVPKSTMHRWAVNVDWPVGKSEGKEFLLADGTKFKRQPGERGEVRIVLEIGKNGQLRVLGVWAGTSWKDIGKEVKRRIRGQPDLFIGDGERAMEMWIGGIAKQVQRSHWHLVRDSRVMLWHDGVKGKEAKDVMRKLSQLLAIEIPQGDMEQVSDLDKAELELRLATAERELAELQEGFEKKGYGKAAQYLENARENLFRHLRLWLQTGIIAPRTASIVENVIKELGRRLKKVGWNWSDQGATKMGRMVMLRRYDPEQWKKFWQDRMNLNNRCKISLTKFETRLAA